MKKKIVFSVVSILVLFVGTVGTLFAAQYGLNNTNNLDGGWIDAVTIFGLLPAVLLLGFALWFYVAICVFGQDSIYPLALFVPPVYLAMVFFRLTNIPELDSDVLFLIKWGAFMTVLSLFIAWCEYREKNLKQKKITLEVNL